MGRKSWMDEWCERIGGDRERENDVEAAMGQVLNMLLKCGGQVGRGCRKLETAQLRLGRRLLGPSRTRSRSTRRSGMEEAGREEGGEEGIIW